MTLVYLTVWAHFVSDFILQSDSMAKGKSSSNVWLSKHIAAYTGAMLAIVLLFSQSLVNAALFAVVNGAAHFATDYITSRITSRLWAEKRVHDFFVVIGLDQAIHITTLVASLPLLSLKL